MMFRNGTRWENAHQALSRLLCRLFGHSNKRVQKMWCSLCARCSTVVEEKPRQVVLPAERQGTFTHAFPKSSDLAAVDEMMAEMRALIDRHRSHPERTLTVQADLGHLGELRAALTPLSPMRVKRSDFLRPDDVTFLDDVTVFGRFAWFRLMRTVHAPWPEEALAPDEDFPRDAPPA